MLKKATLVRWSARLAILAVLVCLGCLVYFFPRLATAFGLLLSFLLFGLLIVNIVASVLFCKRYAFNVLEREWKTQFEIRDELRRTRTLYRLRILDSGNTYQALAALQAAGLVESRRREWDAPWPGHYYLTEYRLTEAGLQRRTAH